MKIYVSKTHADLEAPIQMTDDQREKFISFFKDRFEDLEVLHVAEPDKTPPGANSLHRNWTVDEFLALLKPNDNAAIASEIKRSEMSIRMQRGSFVPDFISWMKKHDYSEPYTRKMIKEYREERGYR